MARLTSLIAKQAAKDLLKKTKRKPGSFVDVHSIAKSLGIEIMEGEFTDTKKQSIAGLIKIGKDGNPVIALNKDDSPERIRFTIGHEIGHYILHRDKELHVDQVGYEFSAFRNSVSSQATDVREIQANQFASALLMPDDEIRSIIKNIFVVKRHEDREVKVEKIIEKVKRDYKVSKMAATFKVTSLLS